jgi:hypothetical protein
MAHDVFISYSTKDKTIADAVCAKLEENKIRVWIAPRDVSPGSNFAGSIIQAINTCKVFILIWSANTSEHILTEINQAFDKGITIIPFRIQNIQPTDEMRYYLGRTHWLDAINPPLEHHIATLKDTILVNLDSERQAAIQALQSEQETGITSLKQVPAIDKKNVFKPSVNPSRQKKGRESKKEIQPAGAASVARFPSSQSSGGESASQKKQVALKRIWTWGGLLAILVMAIGAAVFWLIKNGLPAAPGNLANTTATGTLRPQGETIIVTRAEDSGPGTLRQALLGAQAGDTITFDPVIFPPDNPTTIFPTSLPLDASSLPRISQGGITIDASNAGVILDGSKLEGDSLLGLVINSDNNIIMGLKVINFSGVGIYLEDGSYNKIGGDRSIGTGPLGQGNLVGSNYIGISILPTSGGNIITGNLIGTDASGTGPIGNRKSGILIENTQQIEDQQQIDHLANTIGPDNIIAYNGSNEEVEGGNITGGVVMDTVLIPTTITANSIYNNTGPGIVFNVDDSAQIKNKPPIILFFDLDSGVVNGQGCHDCIVEIFSTDTQDGKIYEGTATADEYGYFFFRKGEALTGPFLTATSSSLGNNTSEFSQPTPARSVIQIALEAIQNEAPLFQTNFDTWEFRDPVENARVENGKLILYSENAEGANAYNFYNLSSDKYAAEFELRIFESSPEGSCIFGTSDDRFDNSRRAIFADFYSGGRATLSVYLQERIEIISTGTFDDSRSNTVSMIIIGDQIAVFINGQLAYTALDPGGATVYTQQHLLAYYPIMCEFDNYKIWDLSGVDFNP